MFSMFVYGRFLSKLSVSAMSALCMMSFPAVALILSVASVSASAADQVNRSDADYSKSESWLCLPGQQDACAVNLDATVVNADGTTQLKDFVAAQQPAFDCFYVYPTVSMDKTDNSDMVANDAENSVIESQFARFKSVCNTYAPLYRQITLTALRARIEKGSAAGDGALAYGDVENAFDYYLEHFNQGRPFVLIGHSQGSRMLTTLLQKRFDNNAELTKKLISALLIGAPVDVEVGSDRDGSFKHIPLCTSGSQVGCVVAYVSFRSDAPPPEHSLFGKATDENLQTACVNPAALGSDQSAVLDAYLGAKGAGQASAPPQPWAKGLEVDTAFVQVPGLLSAACKSDANGSYLSVTVNGNAEDLRVDDIVGDVVVGGQRRKEWGLHLVDVSIAQGNLISLVQQQAAAWAQQP